METNNTNKKFDTFTNIQERRELELQIEYGRRQTTKYKGDWTASWLLSKIHDPVWTLRTVSSRFSGGEWKGVMRFGWDFILCDGTRFTDDSNLSMRMVSQKAAFLVREPLVSEITSFSAHYGWLCDFSNIIRWLYTCNDVYQANIAFFTRVNNNSIREYIDTYIESGRTGVLRYREIFLAKVYENALSVSPPQQVLNNASAMPVDDQRKIVNWLEDNGFYANAKGRVFRFRYLSRNKLAKLIGTDPADLASGNLAAFFRHFEPEALAISNNLLIPVSGVRTECVSHRTPLIQDILTSKSAVGSCQQQLFVWECLFRMRTHLPDAMPPADRIRFGEMRRDIVRKAEPPGLTPWIPLKVSLAYTTAALKWIAVYGEDLVDFYLKAVNTFLENGWFVVDENDKEFRYPMHRSLRDEWVASNLPPALRGIGVKRWTSWFIQGQPDPYKNLRSNPSLNDALQVLVGAIAILIATLKPMRESELLMLKRNCVTLVKEDGYWLEHVLRKNNVNDLLNETQRPIPAIVAKAILQMVKLGEALSKLSSEPDSHAGESLFYLPAFSGNASFRPRLVDGARFMTAVDRFCDYVGLAPDSLGRRWYARIHELRKSFLITFFWCFKYSSIDAARWIAGHNNHLHIYNYIQANFPGQELPQLEANYAAAQLWDFEITGSAGETENIRVLHQDVCEHFGVNAINLVSEQDLSDWLEIAFRKRVYKIFPYAIEDARGGQKTNIAFKIQNANERASNEQ